MFHNKWSACTSSRRRFVPILDFFGVSVKAKGVPQQVECMYFLTKKVCICNTAVTMYACPDQLEVGAVKAVLRGVHSTGCRNLMVMLQ